MFPELISQLQSKAGLCLMLVVSLQGLLLAYDEIVLHRAREMPVWERWGHPMDTFFFALPFLASSFGRVWMTPSMYICLAILSSLVILKDEWVHTGRISAQESFLHGCLFLLHPVTLYWGYENYILQHTAILAVVATMLVAVLCLQILFWNIYEPRMTANRIRTK